MPDLSALSSKTCLGVALNRMFCGGGPKDPKSHALLMNYNRVVDILVEDYEAARRCLIRATQVTCDPPLHALFLAIGHFENCVTTALRAIHFAQRLRNSNRVIVPPKMAVLAGGVEKRIRDMRNAIEHLDEQIACEQWNENEPFCLMGKEDHIELAGQTIQYSELAQWIQDLHGLATITAQYKEI